MKHSFGDWAGRAKGNIMLLLAGISLLFPSSASVLCVSPGGHVEIEDINATCCATSGEPAPLGHRTNDGFDDEGGCQNCTDFFMTPSGRGGLSKSSDTPAPDPAENECFGHNLPAGRSPLHEGSNIPPESLTPVSSSVLLRC